MTLDPRTIVNRRWRRVAEMAPRAGEGPHVPSPCQSVCIMHPDTGWCERDLPDVGNLTLITLLDRNLVAALHG